MSPVPAVIVPPDLHGDWLNPATDDENEVRQLLETIPEPHLPLRVVDKAVGNVRAHVDRMPEFPGVEQGGEPHPTIYRDRNDQQSHHVDYAFLSAGTAARITIGDREDWLEHSSHMPLILDIEHGARVIPVG